MSQNSICSKKPLFKRWEYAFCSKGAVIPYSKTAPGQYMRSHLLIKKTFYLKSVNTHFAQNTSWSIGVAMPFVQKVWSHHLLKSKTNQTWALFLVTSQVHYLLWSSIQCQYSQIIAVISTVTAQFSSLTVSHSSCWLLRVNWYLYKQRLLIKYIINWCLSLGILLIH